ncbi:Fc.00g074460.m01.CDS01 [Cosmosporella sp. VM-42]
MATSHLVKLPPEILAATLSYLLNRDIKNLRLACKKFFSRARLRINRVFLSPNPRNIEVFRAIADHETWRKGIVEIIWDDAWLGKPWKMDDGYGGIYDDLERVTPPPDDIPELDDWWWHDCRQSLSDTAGRRAYVEHPESIAIQKQIDTRIRSIEALKYGLKRFPLLDRVIVTAAAHGWLFSPLYETPMIRAFPKGFLYPIPRGWPLEEMAYRDYARGDSTQPEAHPWTEDDTAANEEYKNQWRGFRVVTRVLAGQSQDHNVKELVCDTHGIQTGLNCRIFDDPCSEYNDIVTILRKPGFRRIDLALIVDMVQHIGWRSFNVSIQTDFPGIDESLDNFIPLRTMFPVDRWPRLQHFRLSQFPVKQDDMLALLAALPPTLRSLELSRLEFLPQSGNHRDLLTDMRDTLGWRDRPIAQRPNVAIALSNQSSGNACVWIDKEVNGFLYDHGENPFNVRNGDEIATGTAGVERDPFKPGWERPRTRSCWLPGVVGYVIPDELQLS